MTLSDDGWEPVTPIGSQGEYTWRLWCDARRPAEADVLGWQGDFLATFIEVVDGAGRTVSGGIGGMREPGERVRYFTSRDTGFPRFVGVRYADDVHDVALETTRRRIDVDAEEAETYYGMRFFVMPMDEGEDLIAVSGGGVRKVHHDIDWLPDEPKTGYFPLPT